MIQMPETQTKHGAEAECSASLKFERRRGDRYPVSGRVTVLRCDHDPKVYQHPICSMQLNNMAEGGMAALSDIPLKLDEIVAVHFAPHGHDMGLDLRGHVVRCIVNERGYHVAIQFDRNRAA